MEIVERIVKTDEKGNILKVTKVFKNEKENRLIFIVKNIDGTETVREIPIRNEDGTLNREIRGVMVAFNNSKNEIEEKTEEVTEEVPSDELDKEDTEEVSSDEIANENDEEVIETKKHKVVKEEKASSKLDKARAAIGGAIAMTGILAIIFACRSCGKEDIKDDAKGINTETNMQTDDEVITPSNSIEELISDSRYTDISEEMLVDTTQNLIQEYAKYGIELNGEDALTFVAIANITHLEQTNPELLKKVLGDFPDAETILTKTGHIIGQVVGLEVSTKDKQVDWTIALIDETDKKIAQHGMENAINAAKLIAADETLTISEKETAIQALVQEQYIKSNFDKTEGYDFADGTHTSLSQEDGADFVTDAIITGILMGDNTLKNYIYGSETHQDLLAISYNEDSTSNIMRMIEECQNVDVNTNNSYVR